MELNKAVTAFAALAQDTRLKAFRALVEAGHSGLAAGVLSEYLGTPHNTLSFHLNHLSNAGLVTSRREGRSIIYSANFDVMRDVLEFLIQDCCSGDMVSIKEDKKAGCSVIELSGC